MEKDFSDLKGSCQTGMPSTPVATPDSLIINTASHKDLFELIKTTEVGFLVGSVLGCRAS